MTHADSMNTLRVCLENGCPNCLWDSGNSYENCYLYTCRSLEREKIDVLRLGSLRTTLNYLFRLIGVRNRVLAPQMNGEYKMARAITKSFSSKSVILTVRRFDGGKLVSEVYEFAGCKSERAAIATLTKQLGTTNFMVAGSEVSTDGDEKRYTMSADKFVSLAHVCEDGVVYGHDTVTATFKITEAEYYTMDSMNAKKYYYNGVTTERKLRKAISDSIGDGNILVGKTNTVNIRYFMTRDEFIENAKEC